LRHRVVITGIGWVTPLGHDIETVWAALLRGACGIAPTRHFDASTFPTSFSAQVRDYDYRRYVRNPGAGGVHEGIRPQTAFALGAAAQAWQSAGLQDCASLDHDRLGIYLGSGEGPPDFDTSVGVGLHAWDAQKHAIDTPKWFAEAQQRFNAVCEAEVEPNMALAHLALEFEARGPACNCLTACAASTQAIGEATETLRRGDADVMICGGAHTMIHPFGVTGFNRLTALSTRNDSPLTAARPFDRTRDGFVLGEGSGMLILETLEHATKRGAPILGEVVGYGSSADAFRITDIPDDGHGAVASMRLALADAGLKPTDIGYISAHGTGTKENDATETLAVKTVFGDHAKNVPMSSVKSMLGHLIAAAGAVELITCVLAIRDGKLPPTINLTQPDLERGCDLDYVPNQSRAAQVDVCLSNSFGFGGQNDTLIIKRLSR
jgi:3-oxoacyl-[acyl-carrier-protein] synthase II